MADLDPMHFDGMAGDYTAARPPYPADLWRDVFATGVVAPGRRALDLGAGSGQATGELLARGMNVVAVEPGPHLADALAKRYPRATVIQSRAEDILPDAGSFELAVAATSIHWMDLDVVLPIVHRALTTSGRLLVWRNVFGDAAADITPFRREVERIVQRRDAARSGDPEDLGATVRKLVHTGLFTIDETHRYRWTIEMTTDRVRELFRTFSDWTADEAEEASLVVAALGGTVSEAYTSWLIVGSRSRWRRMPGFHGIWQLFQAQDSTGSGGFLQPRAGQSSATLSAASRPGKR